ncbi:MAG: hypothetical protein CL670_04945 [Balneola sp.]|jgi:hypothetical protein|nr:hypothetical protein [Balneola sp.]MBE78478.1 hypothetical protein [Balneola sp.]HBX66128.1 hypothetical protein [Balneolaceae bacterium]|tara:strand:- start:979 stop:1440 length:462 start_codon:yes stop_codon:yes gene_type:complete
MFRYVSSLLILTLIAGMTNSHAQSLDNFDLGDYKWNSRVLVVFSPNTFNADYRDQTKALKDSKSGIEDRDLEVFYVLDQSSALAKGKIIPDDEAANLRNQFDVPSQNFTTILIGKDGTEKLRTSDAVSTKKLFETIDAMPMRKLEMKKGDGSN